MVTANGTKNIAGEFVAVSLGASIKLQETGQRFMDTSAIDTDILIVGAGPVGLFLANECTRRGLRWRLIEARSSQSVHSKALAIFPRTLEIFDMAGTVAPFLGVANRVNSVAVVAHHQTLTAYHSRPRRAPTRLLPWFLKTSLSSCSSGSYGEKVAPLSINRHSFLAFNTRTLFRFRSRSIAGAK